MPGRVGFFLPLVPRSTSDGFGAKLGFSLFHPTPICGGGVGGSSGQAWREAEAASGKELKLKILWGGREERMTSSRDEVFPGVRSYSKERLTTVGPMSASLSFNSQKAQGEASSGREEGCPAPDPERKMFSLPDL